MGKIIKFETKKENKYGIDKRTAFACVALIYMGSILILGIYALVNYV